MEANENKESKFRKHFLTRNLISSKEEKVSFLQILGFKLILIGLIIMFYSVCCGTIAVASGVAISFFTIMLGFAFAFPSLLQDKNNGLSTMRIVVFMMVNIICILLLKIGWNAKDFAEIKIDGYWVSIIAFVFGAKATQSFLESKLAVPEVEPTKTGVAALNYTNADIAKLAVEQNQQYLKIKFPNVVSISDAVHNLNQTETHVIALYLKDNNAKGIPEKLEVKMPDGAVKTIDTEIISNVGKAKIQIGQGSDNISDSANPDYTGSICCMVKSTTDPNFFGVVTSGHVYSNGSFLNCGGLLNGSQKKNILIDGTKAGEWYLQLMNNQQDLAIAKLDSRPDINSAYKSFPGEYYTVTDADVNPQTPNVTIISNKKTRDAFIVDYDVAFDIDYTNKPNYVNNIILIGSSNIRDKSSSLSEGGDSGGCVYHKTTNKLIGMLLGGNDKFTFILPIKDTLDYYNFKPL